MANELQFYGTLAQSGLTVTSKVYNAAGAQVGSDVTMTETGSLGIYKGNMPTAPLGKYGARFFNGASLLGNTAIYWDGYQETYFNGLDNVNNFFYVSGDGNSSNSGKNRLNAFRNLYDTASIAASGDTVIVMPGYYDNEFEFLTGGVTYVFEPGTTVTVSDEDESIFTDGVGNPMNFNVLGHAHFVVQGLADSVLRVKSNSNVIFECDRITSAKRGFVVQSGGVVHAKVNTAVTEDGTIDILNENAQMFVEIDTAISAGYVIENDGGHLNYKGRYIQSTGNEPIAAIGLIATTIIDGAHIVTEGVSPISLATAGGDITLKNCSFEFETSTPFQADVTSHTTFLNCHVESSQVYGNYTLASTDIWKVTNTGTTGYSDFKADISGISTAITQTTAFAQMAADNSQQINTGLNS